MSNLFSDDDAKFASFLVGDVPLGDGNSAHPREVEFPLFEVSYLYVSNLYATVPIVRSTVRYRPTLFGGVFDDGFPEDFLVLFDRQDVVSVFYYDFRRFPLRAYPGCKRMFSIAVSFCQFLSVFIVNKPAFSSVQAPFSGSLILNIHIHPG